MIKGKIGRRSCRWYRMKVLERISTALGTAIEPLIEVEEVLRPQDIEQRTSSVGGALIRNQFKRPNGRIFTPFE
jgi:hypothetical protein